MQRVRIAWLFLVCALAVATPRPAAAQGEVFGGYSFLYDSGGSILAATANDNRFVIGWLAGGALPVRHWLSAAAEASGHYKSRTTLDDDVTVSFHTVAAGPRARAAIGPFSQFVQVLAGVAHGRASAFGAHVSNNGLLLQPGGGLDFPLTRRASARAQFDYRWIARSDQREHLGQFRASAALVVH